MPILQRHLLLCFSIIFVINLNAQIVKQIPSDEHKKLAVFLGDWTIEGLENNFKEHVEWFDGNFHVVSNYEMKDSNNLILGRGIIGYSSLLKTYTYYSYSNNGRNSYYTASCEGNVWTFIGTTRHDGKIKKQKVTLIFTEDGNSSTQLFEVYEDNGAWKQISKQKNIRIR